MATIAETYAWKGLQEIWEVYIGVESYRVCRALK